LNMKRIKKRAVQAAVVLLCLASLSGCFDRRELDTIGIVMGVAIDKAVAEGETELTIQMANPSEKSGTNSKEKNSGSESTPFINVSSTGRNINYIVREMQNKMSRMIYVAHSQVIILGEELAKSGVRDVLDFFARAPEARMTLYVIVAKGKAGDMLEITPEFESVPSTELVKKLKDQKITSRAPAVTEFEFVSTMVNKTTAAVAPVVSLEEGKDGRKIPYISGCAVFKDSAMVGELGRDETRGLLLVKNKSKTGVLQLNVLDTPATVEIRQAKSKVTPVLYTDGKIQMQVKVKLIVGLGDQSGTVNLSAPENANALISAVEAAVKSEIQSAVEKSKELNADVFGFGEYLNRKYPDKWREMEPIWDELYKNVNVNISIKVKTDGSGRINKPLIPAEA
jgi:Ger(x)C family germination protein